jgi:hypothetical protein
VADAVWASCPRSPCSTSTSRARQKIADGHLVLTLVNRCTGSFQPLPTESIAQAAAPRHAACQSAELRAKRPALRKRLRQSKVRRRPRCPAGDPPTLSGLADVSRQSWSATGTPSPNFAGHLYTTTIEIRIGSSLLVTATFEALGFPLHYTDRHHEDPRSTDMRSSVGRVSIL